MAIKEGFILSTWFICWHRDTAYHERHHLALNTPSNTHIKTLKHAKRKTFHSPGFCDSHWVQFSIYHFFYRWPPAGKVIAFFALVHFIYDFNLFSTFVIFRRQFSETSLNSFFGNVYTGLKCAYWIQWICMSLPDCSDICILFPNSCITIYSTMMA